jgi:hypothetical protein
MSDELDQATRDELEADIAMRTAFIATLPEGSLALVAYSEGLATRIAQLTSLLPPPPKSKAVLTPPLTPPLDPIQPTI